MTIEDQWNTEMSIMKLCCVEHVSHMLWTLYILPCHCCFVCTFSEFVMCQCVVLSHVQVCVCLLTFYLRIQASRRETERINYNLIHWHWEAKFSSSAISASLWLGILEDVFACLLLVMHRKQFMSMILALKAEIPSSKCKFVWFLILDKNLLDFYIAYLWTWCIPVLLICVPYML